MKRIRRAAIFALTLSLLAGVAAARSEFVDADVQEARQSELGQAKLLEVPFYMAGQAHPKVLQNLGDFTSNRRTNAFNKSDEEACRVAFLSAVIALQDRAIQQGGNAVIGIRSVTKHSELKSASQYRCAAGNVVANVALTGTVVRIAK